MSDSSVSSRQQEPERRWEQLEALREAAAEYRAAVEHPAALTQAEHESWVERLEAADARLLSLLAISPNAQIPGSDDNAVGHKWGGDGGCYADHDCGESSPAKRPT